MTTTASALKPFEATLHKSEDWVHWIMDQLHTNESQRAYRVLRAVLHALRDRLTPEEAAHLGAQLPMLIRGLYYEGFNPARQPMTCRSLDEFLQRVNQELQTPIDPDPRTSVSLVFRLLNDRVSQGEIQDVKGMLPKELQDCWPD